MEKSDRRGRDRLVAFLDRADQDLSFAYTMTLDRWGKTQAELYLDFLLEVCQELAKSDVRGQKLESDPTLLVYVARFSQKRMSHGHRIFYREVSEGIEVVRVMHTAMDWADELD